MTKRKDKCKQKQRSSPTTVPSRPKAASTLKVNSQEHRKRKSAESGSLGSSIHPPRKPLPQIKPTSHDTSAEACPTRLHPLSQRNPSWPAVRPASRLGRENSATAQYDTALPNFRPWEGRLACVLYLSGFHLLAPFSTHAANGPGRWGTKRGPY